MREGDVPTTTAMAVIHFSSDTKQEAMETDKEGGATENEVCACDCHVVCVLVEYSHVMVM